MKRTTVIFATMMIGLPWAAAEREPAKAIAGLSVHGELEGLATHMVPEGILESLLNPSRQMKQGYESVVITLKNKDVRVGTLHRKTKSEILLRDASGKISSIPRNQVAKLDTSGVSMMPPGLTGSLRRDELLDLLHYLMHLR